MEVLLVQLVFTEVPCNWVQCQENSIDPVHFEWLHSYWSYDVAGRTGKPAPPHVRVGFDEFEFGFVYRRLQEGMTEEAMLVLLVQPGQQAPRAPPDLPEDLPASRSL